jgi:tRNA(Leu) C34 or U34 (ribose-2'-O)-methylase TrmL
MPVKINRIGWKFNKLTCLEYKPRINSKNKTITAYICKCDCGNTTYVDLVNLNSGRITSCGCSRYQGGYGEISKSYWYTIRWKANNERKIEWDIDIKQAWNLFEQQEGKCALSGIDLKFVQSYGYTTDKHLQTASLDRIDNTKGYLLDNIQWVHKDINILKNKFSLDEFLYWCDLINGKIRNYEEKYIFPYGKYKNGNYQEYRSYPNRYWLNVQNNAKKRNLLIEFSIEKAYEIYLKQNKNCAISNIPIEFIVNYIKNSKYQTASLDRINNKKDYTIDNIQWIHKSLNRMKNNYSMDIFLYWTKLVSNYQECKQNAIIG